MLPNFCSPYADLESWHELIGDVTTIVGLVQHGKCEIREFIPLDNVDQKSKQSSQFCISFTMQRLKELQLSPPVIGIILAEMTAGEVMRRCHVHGWTISRLETRFYNTNVSRSTSEWWTTNLDRGTRPSCQVKVPSKPPEATTVAPEETSGTQHNQTAG